MEQRLCLPEDWQGGNLLLESHELLACSLFHQGVFAKALEHAEYGLKLYDPQQHSILTAPHGEDPGVHCHNWVALSLWFLGFPDRARAHAYEALDLSKEPGHLYSQASAQVLATFLHQFRREEDTVRKLADVTIALATEQGFPYRVAQAKILQGWALAYQEQGEEAIEQIRQGLAGCDKVGARMDYPYFLALLAEAYAAIDQVEEGIATLDEALATVRDSRTFFYEAELHRLKGALLLQTGNESNEVEPLFQHALDVARRQNAKSLELRATMSLSRLWHQQGKRDEAHALLAETFGWFTEGFDTPDLQQAKALLEALENEGMAQP